MEHVERMGNKTDANRLLVWKPQGKRSLGSDAERRIKFQKNLKEIRCEGFILLNTRTTGELL